MLEETGRDPYQSKLAPTRIMTKTRQQEWEEAIELDRVLEKERRDLSQKRLQQQQDAKFNEYIDKTANPAIKNYSSGMSGVLGGSSPYISNPSSLPDLMASKRECKSTQSYCFSVTKRNDE